MQAIAQSFRRMGRFVTGLYTNSFVGGDYTIEATKG